MICIEMLFIDEIYQGQVLEGLESSCMKVLNALYQTEGKFIFISSNSAVRDTVTRPNIYQKHHYLQGGILNNQISIYSV